MDDDKKPKKASLRGRGRDLMRGPQSSQEDDTTDSNAGSWLPPADEDAEDDAAYFDNEDEVLRFLEADPEAHRPTAIPDQSLLGDLNKEIQAADASEADEEDIFAEPDFDTIFGVEAAEGNELATPDPEPVTEPPPPPQEEWRAPANQPQTLDDIFAQDDPRFDDLFGNLLEDDNDQPAENATLATPAPPDDDAIDELTSVPLPETGELFADDLYQDEGMPGFVDQRPDAADSFGFDEYVEDSETTQIHPRDIAKDDAAFNDSPDTEAPEVETFAEPPPDDFITEEAPEERFALEEAPADDFITEPPPEDDFGLEVLPEPAVETLSDDPTEDDFASEEADTTEVTAREVAQDSFTDEPTSDMEETLALKRSLAAEPGEATDILNARFDDDDDAPADDALAWLAEMPDDEMPPAGVQEALSEPMRLPALQDEVPEVDDALAEVDIPPLDDITGEPSVAFDDADAEDDIDGQTIPIMGADAAEVTEDDLLENDEEPPDFDLAAIPSAPAPEFAKPPAQPPRAMKLTRDEDDNASEAERFIAMLEDESAGEPPSTPPPSFAAAAESPPDEEEMEVLPPVVADGTPARLREEGAFALASRGEAIPRAEEDEAETIDLRERGLRRSDDLMPPEPETLTADEQAYDMFDVEDAEGDYTPDRFEDVFEAAQIGGTQPDNIPEEAVSRSSLVPLMGLSSDAPLPDPFGSSQEERRPAMELFKPSEYDPDPQMLANFVDDRRVRDLFERIEALQEDIIENVRGDRGLTDIYQEELLHAHNMLLHSRAYYDEAKAIVNRVRADIKREQRVREAVSEYRPLIINIYLGMAIFIMVMSLLGQLFVDIPAELGVSWIGHGYYPALAGMVGALLFGYRTLNKHTTIQRDFDESHIHWYWLYPLGGLISGFLVYLLLLSPSVTTLNTINTETTGTSPVTLLLAGGVGYNQNLIRGILESARDRISTDGNSTTPRR